ncbi:LysM peptidoglycan-binding domain-containing protein [Weissella confusa]|uniref:LysM peptidoglycan-binding domain-containing protein n=1 Tax=Weissella confusa TaxID=1583 RepID=UPI00223C3AB2|nr:LysM peptidoglycan-binding domain-containing protein [Weissella confusa]
MFKKIAVSLAVLAGMVLAGTGVASADSHTITVQPGDTLSELALQNGTTVEAIVAINGLGNPDLIFAGEQYEMPDNNDKIWLDYTDRYTGKMHSDLVTPIQAGWLAKHVASDVYYYAGGYTENTYAF